MKKAMIMLAAVAAGAALPVVGEVIRRLRLSFLKWKRSRSVLALLSWCTTVSRRVSSFSSTSFSDLTVSRR